MAEKYKVLNTKVTVAMAEQLSRIARAKNIEIYELLQLCCWFLIRMTSPQHNLSEEMEKLMTIFHSEPDWEKAFNLCNPSADNEIVHEILILQQEVNVGTTENQGPRKGFGAVMITKPWMGIWQQTECVESIMETVTKACVPGIYKRLRFLGEEIGSDSIVDILINLLDNAIIEKRNENDRREIEQAVTMQNGQDYRYGRRTRQTKKRTPDDDIEQTVIRFDAYDRSLAEEEVEHDS